MIRSESSSSLIALIWGLDDIRSEEDDEDDDDQHNDANYDHHFYVFPPVLPGNSRRCSLE